MPHVWNTMCTAFLDSLEKSIDKAATCAETYVCQSVSRVASVHLGLSAGLVALGSTNMEAGRPEQSVCTTQSLMSIVSGLRGCVRSHSNAFA